MTTQKAFVFGFSAIVTVAASCLAWADTKEERFARHDRLSEIAERIHERDIDVENWPESMSAAIKALKKRNISLQKWAPQNAGWGIKRQIEFNALEAHLNVFEGINQSFESYATRKGWVDGLGVNTLCGLLKSEFTPAMEDFRGRSFKDVPRRLLPVDIFLGTTDEPVDFRRFGGRVGNVLVRAEHIWTWMGITVCDLSEPNPKSPPTVEQVTALLRKYFRHPLVPWGANPDPDSPYLELLRTDGVIVSGVHYMTGKPDWNGEPNTVGAFPLNPHVSSFCFLVVSDGRFIHIAAQISQSPLTDRPNQW